MIRQRWLRDGGDKQSMARASAMSTANTTSSLEILEVALERVMSQA